MVNVYVSLITKGLRTIQQVPSLIREQVKDALIDAGYSELAKE